MTEKLRQKFFLNEKLRQTLLEKGLFLRLFSENSLVLKLEHLAYFSLLFQQEKYARSPGSRLPSPCLGVSVVNEENSRRPRRIGARMKAVPGHRTPKMLRIGSLILSRKALSECGGLAPLW